MAQNHNITAKDIIHFWFEETEPKNWWVKDPEFDQHIKSRFGDIYYRAAASELTNWRNDPLSSLAEIIILDQFPRNMFRDTAQAFGTDTLALCLSQHATDKGFDQQLEPHMRAFLYMPLMHSESGEIHKTAEQLFKSPDLENNYEFELKHKAIIDEFGRYPHRNEILARPSTEAEIDFLKKPGSSF